MGQKEVPPARPGPRGATGERLAICLLGLLAAALAYALGSRHYPHAAQMTHVQMMRVAGHMDLYLSGADPAHDVANPVTTLPTDSGEYDLAAAVGPDQAGNDLFSDGWDNPMRLDVSSSSQGTNYVIHSAGPDREWETPDDVSSTGLRIVIGE